MHKGSIRAASGAAAEVAIPEPDRERNRSLARQAGEMLAGIIERAEADSMHGTFGVELSFQGGILRQVARVERETVKDNC